MNFILRFVYNSRLVKKCLATFSGVLLIECYSHEFILVVNECTDFQKGTINGLSRICELSFELKALKDSVTSRGA